MAWFHADNADTLNFVVAGDHHSGYGLLQASLTAHPQVICHGELLHTSDQVRRTEHERYFGDSGKTPDWYVPTQLSAEQYLSNKIFDNVLHAELAVGVKVNYGALLRYDMWEYLEQQSRRGDFCVIQVVRNPVACYVAQQQAKLSVASIYIETPELTEFVRGHDAAKNKLNHLCRDRAIVPYHELLLDFRGVLERLFKFLGLPFSPACVPNQIRVRRKEIRSRIRNWAQVVAEAPDDVQRYLGCPILF
jgi:hypothetical protein